MTTEYYSKYNLNEFTVIQLQELLHKSSLSVSGNKAELIARLLLSTLSPPPTCKSKPPPIPKSKPPPLLNIDITLDDLAEMDYDEVKSIIKHIPLPNNAYDDFERDAVTALDMFYDDIKKLNLIMKTNQDKESKSNVISSKDACVRWTPLGFLYGTYFPEYGSMDKFIIYMVNSASVPDKYRFLLNLTNESIDSIHNGGTLDIILPLLKTSNVPILSNEEHMYNIKTKFINYVAKGDINSAKKILIKKGGFV